MNYGAGSNRSSTRKITLISIMIRGKHQLALVKTANLLLFKSQYFAQNSPMFCIINAAHSSNTTTFFDRLIFPTEVQVWLVGRLPHCGEFRSKPGSWLDSYVYGTLKSHIVSVRNQGTMLKTITLTKNIVQPGIGIEKFRFRLIYTLTPLGKT